MFWGTFVGYAVFYFCRNNLGSALPGMGAEFGYTNTQLGLLASVIYWTYAIGKFGHGVIADRANIRTFMATGLILSAVMNLLFPHFSTLWIMVLIWGLNGWFQSTGWPPCAKMLTHWYGMESRGLIWSLWSSSHQVGGAIIVSLSAYLAQTYGWRAAFTVPAWIAILVGLGMLLTLRDRPVELGLPPIERRGTADGDLAEESREPVWATLRAHVLGNPWIWLLGFQNFCVYVARYGTLVWMVKFLVEKKQSGLASAGAKTAVIELAGIFGGIAAGWLSDKLKGHRSRLNVFFLVLLGLSIHVFWFIPGDAVALQVAALGAIGFLVYGPQLLVAGPCTADLVPRKAAATATGFVGMFGYIGSSLIAGVFSGRVIDLFGWKSAFLLWTLMAFAGAALGLVMWNLSPSKGNRGLRKA
ncbi:MAG: MFS transporter [Pseudomonadota bacterium]